MNNKKDGIVLYYDPDALLSDKEADSLIKEKVEKIILVYEKQGKGIEIKEATETVEPNESTDGVETTEKENEETESEEDKAIEKVEQEEKKKEDVNVAAGTQDADEDYVVVANYDTIVKELFTENGIKELESTKFEKKAFVVKEEGKVKFLKKLPQDNRFSKSNVSVSMIKVKQEEITAQVTLTNYGLKDDVLTYYVIIKNIKLVKKDDSWFVESFNYANE
jgi:hypothetical protein